MSNEVLDALNRHTIREESRLDAIHERLTVIASVQGEQAGVLREHIRRSEANEEAVALLGKRIRFLEDAGLGWSTLGKAAAAGATAVGGVVTILKLVGVL